MRHDTDYLADMIADIKQMVLALTTLNKQLKNRVSRLELEKKDWDDEKKLLRKKIEAMEVNYEALMFAKTMEGTEGKEQTRNRITALVREIDQCIVLIQNLQ